MEAHTEIKQKVRAMTDAELEKELAFAEGFAEGVEISEEERDWLAQLRVESAKRLILKT